MCCLSFNEKERDEETFNCPHFNMITMNVLNLRTAPIIITIGHHQIDNAESMNFLYSTNRNLTIRQHCVKHRISNTKKQN